MHASFAMETKFENLEISNNNATEATPNETLVERLSQQYTPEYVANIKQEFNAAQFPEKFSFYEKFITARLGKIAQVITNNPRQHTNLDLVLRELLQTAPSDVLNKQEQNKIASPFVKELTTTKEPTYKELVAATPSNKKTALLHHLSSITSLVLSTNNKTMFTGSTNRNITVWDVSDPAKPTHLASLDEAKTGHSSAINCLAISSDNKTLFSGSNDKTIKIWSIINPANPILFATINNINPSSLCVSSNNKTLFCGSQEGAITIYDITNLSNPTLIGAHGQAHIENISSLILSTDNKTLFSGSQAKTTFTIWNVSDPRNITEIISKEVYEFVHDLALSNDNKTLFVGRNKGSTQVWDISNVKDPRLLSTMVSEGKSINNIKIRLSSDNKTLFCLTSDQTINIWNISNLKDPIFITPVEPPIVNRNKNSSKINLVLFNDQIIYQVCGFDNKLRQCDASFLSNICSPTLTNYFTQLPSSPEGVIEYFFIKELLDHKNRQLKAGCTTPKPLAITDALLIELFNQLPKELQQEIITKKYVTFARQTYKQYNKQQ